VRGQCHLIIPVEEEEEEEEEEEFIQNRIRAGARFLTRWDQHAVAQRRPYTSRPTRPTQEEFIQNRRRSLLRIVHARGAIFNEMGPTRYRARRRVI